MRWSFFDGRPLAKDMYDWVPQSVKSPALCLGRQRFRFAGRNLISIFFIVWLSSNASKQFLRWLCNICKWGHFIRMTYVGVQYTVTTSDRQLEAKDLSLMSQILSLEQKDSANTQISQHKQVGAWMSHILQEICKAHPLNWQLDVTWYLTAESVRNLRLLLESSNRINLNSEPPPWLTQLFLSSQKLHTPSLNYLGYIYKRTPESGFSTKEHQPTYVWKMQRKYCSLTALKNWNVIWKQCLMCFLLKGFFFFQVFKK